MESGEQEDYVNGRRNGWGAFCQLRPLPSHRPQLPEPRLVL